MKDSNSLCLIVLNNSFNQRDFSFLISLYLNSIEIIYNHVSCYNLLENCFLQHCNDK